jgi:hypothetical protein
MTPVTSRIPDGKKYGFHLLACLLECFFSPGMPINRIEGMLEQIRALFENKTVRLSGVQLITS